MSGALRGTWRRLGIEPTADQGVIRRAYADALRAMDVDADVAGFAALRDARDTALAWARQQPKDAAPEAPERESLPPPSDATPPKIRPGPTTIGRVADSRMAILAFFALRSKPLIRICSPPRTAISRSDGPYIWPGCQSFV